MSSMLRKHFVLQLFESLCPEFIGENVSEFAKQNPARADFIARSLNFAYDAENELFCESNSRDAYFGAMAEKIYTLCEAAKQRQRDDDGEEGGAVEGGGGTGKRRTLADVLKANRSAEI